MITSEFCEKNNIDKHYCHHSRHRIDNRVRDVIDRFNHINFFDNKKTRIGKRGWVDCVGRLSKFLFGTMNSTDEEEIKTSLRKLESQKDNSWDFMGKQIYIIYLKNIK